MRFSSTVSVPFASIASSSVAQVRELVVQQLARLRLFAHLVEIVLVLFGAVRHLVGHRLRIRPQPGDRPEQTAEHQRQQAQHLDGVALRMMTLVGDLLRKDVNQPEQHDRADRDEDDDEPRKVLRRRVHHLRREERSARGRRKGQRGDDKRAAATARCVAGADIREFIGNGSPRVLSISWTCGRRLSHTVKSDVFG